MPQRKSVLTIRITNAKKILVDNRNARKRCVITYQHSYQINSYANGISIRKSLSFQNQFKKFNMQAISKIALVLIWDYLNSKASQHTEQKCCQFGSTFHRTNQFAPYIPNDMREKYVDFVEPAQLPMKSALKRLRTGD